MPNHTPFGLAELSHSLRTGQLNLERYLNQLEGVVESREPAVLSLLPEEGRFDRLRRQASDLATHFPDPASRPPLYGIPIGVKDIFAVDGFPTRAGSRLPPEVLGGTQAESVTRLLENGALLLGKTVTTEFAYFVPGPTRNPHNPAHTPGGSSSGSAAAVGAGIAPLALGTQTIGSITRPAAFCGVVGFKPSRERISREGVIPLSPSLDHVGFFTTDVASAAMVAALLVSDWGNQVPERAPVLAIPEGPYLQKASDKGLEHFQATCDRLSEAGYQIVTVLTMADFDAVVERHNLILAAEAAQVHAGWFAEFQDRYHAKTAELIGRGQEIDMQALRQALNGREELRQQLTALMDENGIDLWLSPAAPGPAPKGLESTGNPVMNLPWTHCGLPTLNLPWGANSAGLPYGLQIAARLNADEAMLSWSAGIARALEEEA
jgi:Asp-tRNA(Asn)/Glu-tRNA(Gln) amidotransferase A subunit family amidase